MGAASLDAVVGYVRWQAGPTMTLRVSEDWLAEPTTQAIQRTPSPHPLRIIRSSAVWLTRKKTNSENAVTLADAAFRGEKLARSFGSH